jgi:hypothetical protein
MTRKPGNPVRAARQILRGAFCATLAIALTGCTLAPTNFSQYPGFAAYYTTHPRRNEAASAEERALLQRFRPRFMLPPGHVGMIDFYRDYIAQGTLYDGEGSAIGDHVTPALLNRHKNEPSAVFVHRPDPTRAARATVLARVDRERVALGAGDTRDLTFLTYHAVFRHSGLPAAVTGWRAGLLGVIADLDDWHQLDHYTAATLVLDSTQTPLALMLQQHNYTRTYIIGTDVSLDAQQRPVVDIAQRSNELYPHLPARTTRRAVRFLTPEAMRYLLGAGPPPRVSGDDITEGKIEADYALAFLAPDDAFYSFTGFLGERRRLPGRDGPPGADFNIWPTLKPLGAQLVAGFFREGSVDDLARFEASYAKSGELLDFVAAQAPVLGSLLACSTNVATGTTTRIGQRPQSTLECAAGHRAPASTTN